MRRKLEFLALCNHQIKVLVVAVAFSSALAEYNIKNLNLKFGDGSNRTSAVGREEHLRGIVSPKNDECFEISSYQQSHEIINSEANAENTLRKV